MVIDVVDREVMKKAWNPDTLERYTIRHCKVSSQASVGLVSVVRSFGDKNAGLWCYWASLVLAVGTLDSTTRKSPYHTRRLYIRKYSL